MNPCWSPLVHRLTPYIPGEQPAIDGLIKLNTNENPYPPSPRVLAALRDELGDDGARLRLYPDPSASRVRQAVSDHFADFGISPAHVFVGNGSDEVLAHTFLALLQQDEPILLPEISYSFYPVYCGLYGIAYRTLALDAHLRIRIEDYQCKNGGILIANPNAPTGHLLDLSAIDALASAHPGVAVIIDEAYIDFGGQTAIALIARHPNLLVIRTLSKSHALAGLRVGYAVGNPGLIEALNRVKDSFNSYPLDRLAIAAAAAALDDREYLERTRQAVMESRTRLGAELSALGFDVLPSAANFLFARHPERDAAALAAALRERKVIVRHFRQPRIDQFLRISIGTDPQCDALIDALKAIFEVA